MWRVKTSKSCAYTDEEGWPLQKWSLVIWPEIAWPQPGPWESTESDASGCWFVCFPFFSLYFCSLRGNKLVSKVPNFISSQKLQGPLPCTRAKMAPKPSHFRSALPSVLAPPQALCPIPRPDVWNPASFGLGLPCHSPCLLDHARNARVCPVQRLWWRDDGLWRPGPGPDWAGNCRRYCHEQGRRHRALHFTPHWLLQARKLRAGRCFLFLLLLCWI